jgi:calcium-dependent protein kinase
MKYHETYESGKFMYLVTEFCGGGELIDRIQDKDLHAKMTEPVVSDIMKKLMRAINHCHANGIAHRDLKPENIMFKSKGLESEIKVIDFGLAKRF